MDRAGRRETGSQLTWMELVILDADGTQRARHVFLTNRELARDKVAAYIDAGRA